MAFDNTSFLATYGDTATVSHAVASGSNRRLYVFVNYDGSGDKVTGVTYGGVAMTRIGYSATDFRIVVYELVDPAVGTANVVGTFTSSSTYSVGVVSCSDATASAVTFAVNGYANSPWSQSTTAVAGDLLVDFLGTTVLDIANAFVPGAGQTQDELYNPSGGMWAMSHKSAASSGSVALTNSWSGGAQKSITSALLLITGAGDPLPSQLAGDIDLADFTLSGDFAVGALSQLSSGFTLDDFVLSGVLGLAPGIVTTNPFKNWSGTLLPGVTVPNVVFLKLDRTIPLALTNQVTAGDAVMTITNAALVTGTYYVMVSYNADGSAIGAELVLAA